jgi:hypothetical protein
MIYTDRPASSSTAITYTGFTAGVCDSCSGTYYKITKKECNKKCFKRSKHLQILDFSTKHAQIPFTYNLVIFRQVCAFSQFLTEQ